jgi:hypothetical protein
VKHLHPNKLDPKSDKSIFVGYPREICGYSFYIKIEGKVFVVKNGVFVERKILTKGLGKMTVQLDEVREPEKDEDSSGTPERFQSRLRHPRLLNLPM